MLYRDSFGSHVVPRVEGDGRLIADIHERQQPMIAGPSLNAADVARL
jgi:hypothetical protein